MGAQLHTPSNLYSYIQKCQKIADLEADLKRINKYLKDIDNSLKQTTNNSTFENCLTIMYNTYNKRRIKLSLEINALEREVLLFELNTYEED